MSLQLSVMAGVIFKDVSVESRKNPAVGRDHRRRWKGSAKKVRTTKLVDEIRILHFSATGGQPTACVGGYLNIKAAGPCDPSTFGFVQM